MTVGIIGFGEIGSTLGRICKEAGFKVLVREIDYDQVKDQQIDYLHIAVPEKDSQEFVKMVSNAILEIKPKLTIINSSVTPGTTDKIYKKTKALVVHSPVMGIHPNLYESVRFVFPKIIGATSPESLREAKRHLKALGLKIEVYDSAKDSEAAKLLDLVYYAWNIIFCKEIKKVCDKLGLNMNQVYNRQNQIYNKGYKKYLPNVVRPILVPVAGPITGHCIIPDVVLFEKYFGNFLTKTIMERDKTYFKEVEDPQKERQNFVKVRNDSLVKKLKR